ncbi:PREDICTED: ubiquitin carboxyl-terminal hydrolase 35-like [Galeopterus variegatus]|uniref:Ubiquitin carboxyl-terminal hydrolase 35-like n=1 Tax=Galeopterus variegatus TaxID=482537 RepID=A0ABM0Q7Q5_GALVR|nr:PREDICTED: ubiquitin carboxyl-terminal hydrolase 35-like [Galeopterus variegatus]
MCQLLCSAASRDLPVRAAAMDKILEAVVTSSYPVSVKQGLVRRVLEAARQPLEREQCLALLVPEGPHRLLFCQQLVRCLGRFRCPAEGEEGAVEFLEQAQQVSGLLAQLWRAQPAAILPCLKELFAVISCTEEEPPSSALASVVQHLPLELMDGVVRNLSNDDSVTDSQMLTAISR